MWNDFKGDVLAPVWNKVVDWVDFLADMVQDNPRTTLVLLVFLVLI